MTVLVTGASSGIGRAAVRIFAREGATVIAAARRREKTEEIVNEVNDAGGSAVFIPVDISDETSIQSLFDQILNDFSRLDGAFNNAGVESDHAPLPDTSQDVFDDTLNINARGTWLCMKAEMDMMRGQGRGAIVNTASIAGLVGFPGASPYVASKHAVVGMTKAAALELCAEGVRINCICPGATRSEMSARWSERLPDGEATLAAVIPARRVADPEEPAELASFLLSPRSQSLIGACIAVDGGYSIV